MEPRFRRYEVACLHDVLSLTQDILRPNIIRFEEAQIDGDLAKFVAHPFLDYWGAFEDSLRDIQRELPGFKLTWKEAE